MKFQIFIRSIGILILASFNIAMAFPPAMPIRQSTTDIMTLEEFAATVENGQAGQVVGVYVPDVLALPVVQQPADSPAYVTGNNGYITQFGLAAQYGTTGLLAHNYLSGALFFNLSAGQEVDVIYGDGFIRRYVISTTRHFQALNPSDPTSDFVDLDDDGGAHVSSAGLFDQIYAKGDQVVFQTCIDANGNPSWGRLFVIATPVSDQITDQLISSDIPAGDHHARRKVAMK